MGGPDGARSCPLNPDDSAYRAAVSRLVPLGGSLRAAAPAQAAGPFSTAFLVELINGARHRVAATSVPPMVAARLYDAAMRAVHDGAAGELGLVPLHSGVAPPGVDGSVAATRALDLVTAGLLTDFGYATAALPASLSSLLVNPPASAVTWSDQVAGAVLANVRADGAHAAHALAASYVVPVGPGRWEPTPPAFGRPLQPYWGTVRMRSIADVALVPITKPPAYREGMGTGLHTQAQNVVRQSQTNTADQIAVARHWADGAGTPTPPGHWMAIGGKQLLAAGVAPKRAVTVAVQLGSTMHDSFVACWHHKYAVNLIRPVSYIRRHLNASWTPLLTTPPFPEYPSGHSTVSAAAAMVIQSVVGTRSFVDDTVLDLGFPARSYQNTMMAAMESSNSRVYGAIHFPKGCSAGHTMGKWLGQQILGRALV